MSQDLDIFERHRASLLALAYRMLGDVARAEDAVQEAWVRWQKRTAEVDSPQAFLITIVARLCLDELSSARARYEESGSPRLPEPIDLQRVGAERVEMLDRVSMAFMVLLQRLTPAERAVFLLHEVFELQHAAIAELLGRSEAACRQLLRQAKRSVASGRRMLETSREEHQRLLRAFVAAIQQGDDSALLELLADDATLIVDSGRTPQTYGKLRQVVRPVVGRKRVIALVCAFARQGVSTRLHFLERELNGEPAVLTRLDGRLLSALLVAVADGRIQHVYLQNDPERLRLLEQSN